MADVSEVSDDVDVVVVGFGIAGGAAAVEAAVTGAKVLVLERAGDAGGTTALAGGHFYLGGGTAVQRATGHDDSPEAMYEYLMAVSPDPEPTKIWAYCRDSVAHFEWLEELGVRFERSFYPEKAVIQPGTEGLMYTGNEQVWPFAERAAPAPRGHKVPVAGDTGGAALVIERLRERLSELGVEVRYDTGATELVTDDTGVRGVAWRHFAETGIIRSGTVVLAAGGFVMNEEMVAAHVPQLSEKPFVLGNTHDDGLGIRLGQSAGAATRNMDRAFVTAPVYPPAQLLTGLVINRDGQRFVAEDSYHSRTSGFVLEQPGAEAYLIVDSEHIEHPQFPLAPFIDGWETIPEMARALGIDEAALEASLRRYNTHAVEGADPDFHKSAKWLAPQDTGPWGAFNLSLGEAVYAGFTLGGLATSVHGEVLDAADTPIPGLYAAGAGAANIAQDGKGYASGTQLGEGSFFGRQAGRHAARLSG